MIGVLASIRAPELFSKLILVGPSARYIDDGNYHGGFSEAQIAEFARISRSEPDGLVRRHGSGHYGQSRPS